MEKEEMVSGIKVKIVTKINAPSLAISLLLLIFVFIVYVLSMPVLATEVVINDASAYPGNITFTDITLENATNVGVIDLSLYYNPSVVIVTGLKDSEFDVTISNLVKNSTGFVRIGAFQIENPELNGSVLIARLKLKAIGKPGDISPLNIVVNELKDATTQANTTLYTYTITNGTFTITPAIDNASPVITITFPINGSTLGILNNSVIGCITSERELTVAKLTLNDDFVTALNKGCFNVKVNYRANETNRIEIFARDKEGNANTSQVLVNVLPNIVFVNKTAIANRTIEINEAKNATNNENTSLWMPLGPGADGDGNPDYTALGGAKVIDSEGNKTEKYLRVTLNHFSTFALVAEKIPAPATPTPTPTPVLKGGGGAGGTFLPTPTPSPTSILTPTPTLAPTVRSSVTPTQTHAQTRIIPTSPVPFSGVKWLIIVIVIIASSVITVSVWYDYCYKKHK